MCWHAKTLDIASCELEEVLATTSASGKSTFTATSTVCVPSAAIVAAERSAIEDAAGDHGEIGVYGEPVDVVGVHGESGVHGEAIAESKATAEHFHLIGTQMAAKRITYLELQTILMRFQPISL